MFELLSGTLMVKPASANSAVSLTADITELNFSTIEPQTIQLIPSDIPETYGKQEYVYLDGQYRSVSTKGYVARVEGVETGLIKVVVSPSDPIVNGTFNLQIDFYHGPALNITIKVNIDVKAQALYSTTFTFECETPEYGKNLKCSIYPEITGSGINMVSGKYKSILSYQTIGTSKFKSDKAFFWNIKESVVYTSDVITKPTKVRATVSFEGKTFKFETDVKLKSYLSIIAPGAAIVGASFTVQVKTVKQYSGECSLYGNKFKVRNGIGVVKVYGVKPGGLTLYVTCPSTSTWEQISGSRYMYIRQ